MKKFDPKSLPYIAATAQTVQFGHAGYVLMGYVGIIIGGIIGAVVSFSVAYAGSQIASLTGQKREKWANAATLSLLVLSPLALVAPSYISFAIVDWPVARIVTAATWALAPDLSILLSGLITGKKLVVAEEKPAKTSNTKKPRRQPITDKQLNDYWLRNPDATNTAVAQHFGVTRQAIGKRKEKLYRISQ